MTKWTHENTEGFTDADLKELNLAQEWLVEDDFGDEKYIAGLLNNVWREDMTAGDLYTAARDVAGANA